MTDNIEDHLEIIQEDVRKIEKQYLIKQDQDQLKRNIHKLSEKSKKLNLTNLISKPKMFEVIKNKKPNKELFVEHQSDNKFKIKGVKIKKRKTVEIPSE